MIETDRLLLRRIVAEDLDSLVAIHADAEVARFMGAFDRDNAREWLEGNQRDWEERGYGRLAIVERATEAALASAAWGFETLGLPRLTAMIRPDNFRSIRVADRLAMTPSREDVLMGDAVVVYSLSSEQWAPRAGAA